MDDFLHVVTGKCIKLLRQIFDLQFYLYVQLAFVCFGNQKSHGNYCLPWPQKFRNCDSNLKFPNNGSNRKEKIFIHVLTITIQFVYPSSK